MKTKQFVIVLLAMAALSLPAAESANRLQFPVSGFSITPLEEPPGENVRQAVIMFLAPSDNFAANVNVQVQPFKGTIDEYVELTLKQFKDARMKLIEQKRFGRSVAVFEYSGDLQGQSLHWYARAEKAGSHVYLATGTAAEPQWSKLAAQLKACVDSLRCENREPGSAPSPGSPPK
jgi:hypothetical protein